MHARPERGGGRRGGRFAIGLKVEKRSVVELRLLFRERGRLEGKKSRL